jgi:hypothetical protein
MFRIYLQVWTSDSWGMSKKLKCISPTRSVSFSKNFLVFSLAGDAPNIK